MLASSLLSVLPVLALVAPVYAGPVHKKRACARPSASASAAASASISESASITISSAIESASTSINTGVFAPASTDASASLEPTSTVESASASASASESASASGSASEEASSTSASAEPAQTSAASSSDAETFVKLHNDFRAQYGAGPVEWDETLATYAKEYAPICQLVHSSGPYGENLAGGAGNGYDITRAFNSWADEGQYYDYSKPGVLEATVDGKPMGLGHFTQVVWKATTKIGCAAVSCADGTLFTGYGESTFVVCEYQDAGNVYLGEGDANALFVENVGQKI